VVVSQESFFRMPIRHLVVLLLAVCLQVGPGVSVSMAQQTPADSLNAFPSVDLPPELASVLRDYETAWQNKDAEGLAALFTEDGFVLRPGHPPVRGREDITDAYAEVGGRLHLRAFDSKQEGDIAYIIGGYAGHETWPDTGKFILALKKNETGRWLIIADMDNRNR
jgi:ketosteroid isomerase-like protein